MGNHSRITFSISFSIGKVGEALTLHILCILDLCCDTFANEGPFRVWRERVLRDAYATAKCDWEARYRWTDRNKHEIWIDLKSVRWWNMLTGFTWARGQNSRVCAICLHVHVRICSGQHAFETEPEDILRSCHVCQLGGCSSLGCSIHKSRGMRWGSW